MEGFEQLRIFEPIVSEGYEWVVCADGSDYEKFLEFDGSLRGATWRPVRMELVREDLGREFKRSDFPWLGAHALVLRKSTVRALNDFLEPNGELLELSIDDDDELYVFNARTVDALDEKGSDIEYFPGTNRIMQISKVAFRESAVTNLDIFRLPHRSSSTYVSDEFVNCVSEAQLVGLEFEEVWRDS